MCDITFCRAPRNLLVFQCSCKHTFGYPWRMNKRITFRVPKQGECDEIAVLLTMKKESISTIIYFAALMPLRQKQELCKLSARRIHVVSITQQLHVMGFSFKVMPWDLLRGTIEEYTNAGWKMIADVAFSGIEREGSVRKCLYVWWSDSFCLTHFYMFVNVLRDVRVKSINI